MPVPVFTTWHSSTFLIVDLEFFSPVLVTVKTIGKYLLMPGP